jgi:hypothetical protein
LTKSRESTVPPAEFYSAFEDYAKTLRTWLVAYGIGAPVFLVHETEAWTRIGKSGNVRTIMLFFLVGVALQVFITALNKSVMWACYFGAHRPEYQSTWRYKAADWLSDKYLIDLACDALSIVLFTWATYLSFTAFAPL